MKREFEHVVVGLGGIGSAAACRLAERAPGEVLGLERFHLGHHRGASQDHSRMMRLSYHAPHYVALARDSRRAWTDLEEEAGERLIVDTGGLDMWPPGSAIPLAPYLESMRSAGVSFDELSGEDAMARWPQFTLPEGTTALFQPDGGIIEAARANAAHVRLARLHGALLLERAPIRSIRDLRDEIEVTTDAGSYRCRSLVIAADAWTNEVLANFGLGLPLTVTEEQVTYFAPSDPETLDPVRFPVWRWMDDPSFYGFPTHSEGAKVAQDLGGPEVTLERRTFQPDLACLERVRGFLERHLRPALGPEVRTTTCLYTMPPDRDLVLDRVPGHPHVFVALGAAHGFKCAPLIGRVLADLAIDGSTEVDVAPFAFDRPSLTDRDAPRSFLR